jgi:hypothetical protein
MNCPKCNIEMKQGYLQTGKPLFWSSKKRAFVPWSDSEAVIFSMSLISGTNLTACHCPSCKLIVTEYTENDLR